MKTSTIKPSFIFASLALVFAMAITALPAQAQNATSTGTASPWCGNGGSGNGGYGPHGPHGGNHMGR
ncbi:MAG: hypothetical protein BCS36_13800 [Desulfovibrio sp. MES5]|uniref:hypothetical protein n=1 Tax=Desulfovibrio sp. MES5 TaxID=1899016 RepID=UPI000B9CF7C3|nr:hypothetical protein [Desulfovibrio sp. MES5]OXS29119.1 MAG: hypothetical protein BCS36_13800 [Desulfovibrio sp. MES5]